MLTESVKHNRCYKQGHDSQYIEKFKDHREVCYRKVNNSGNISMKNNGKDITSLASTFT